MAKKGGLGRGLDALFSDNSAETGSADSLRLSEIEPNREQPRRDFDEAALTELAQSIAEHGIIQPLLVRPMQGGGYQLVAGERRWRAARIAGLEFVPVVIKDLSDKETMEIALIENLQREDLNPVEEAEGYRTLMESFGMTQEETAKRVGKSRPVIANAVRLLSLPEEMLRALRFGDISSGHARALVAMDDEKRRRAFELCKSGATVRELEQFAKKKLPDDDTEQLKPRRLGKPIYVETENALKAYLGHKVSIKKGRGKGVIEIEFYGDDDLIAIANAIAGENK